MIKTKEDLAFYKKQDFIANSFNARGLGGVKLRLFNATYKFLTLLREVEYYKNNPSVVSNIVFLYKWYRFRKISIKLGYNIPPNCFGPGLSLPHYGTIVVNSNAKIGANCRLHCCTNIGASAGKAEAPQIGDNCYIGPGAIIFGDIRIASNATIAANATVNKSFKEEYAVLAGTPARVVKTNMQNWVQFNKIDG